MVYRVTLRTAIATQRDPVIEKKRNRGGGREIDRETFPLSHQSSYHLYFLNLISIALELYYLPLDLFFFKKIILVSVVFQIMYSHLKIGTRSHT